jgi:hypothetical protein
MAFTLPPLPYDKSALSPHISGETLDYHYGKHHQAYVTNLNKLVEGKPEASKTLEDVIASSEGGIFNNAAQIWNHDFYWKSMKPNGGGLPTGDLAEAIKRDFGSFEQFSDDFTAARPRQRQEARCHQDAERRPSAQARPEGSAHDRCLGARVLHRFPQSAAEVHRHVHQALGQLGLRARELEERLRACSALLDHRDREQDTPPRLVQRFHRNDGSFGPAASPRIAALHVSLGLRPNPKVAPATFLVPRLTLLTSTESRH